MDTAVMKVAAGSVVSAMPVGHLVVVVPDRERPWLDASGGAVLATAEYLLPEPDHAEVGSTGTTSVTTMTAAPPWAQLPPVR